MLDLTASTFGSGARRSARLCAALRVRCERKSSSLQRSMAVRVGVAAGDIALRLGCIVLPSVTTRAEQTSSAAREPHPPCFLG